MPLGSKSKGSKANADFNSNSAGTQGGKSKDRSSEIASREPVVPSSGRNISKCNTKANDDTNTKVVKGTENVKMDHGTKNTQDIDTGKTLIKTKTPAQTEQGFALARAPTIQFEDPLRKTTIHTDDAHSSNKVIQSGHNNKLLKSRSTMPPLETGDRRLDPGR